MAFWSKWTDDLLDRALRPGRRPDKAPTQPEEVLVGGGVSTYVLDAETAETGTDPLAEAGVAPAEVVTATEVVPIAETSSIQVIHWVDDLLTGALRARASDIHLESEAERLRVRYRVDGVMEEIPSPPHSMAPAIIARLRVMSGLNLAEHRTPQDGRMRIAYEDRSVDLRVSTVPVLHGESVALRVLDPERGKIDLDHLGMLPEVLERLEAVIARPHGMLLTTGPGGSGKSTTLFSIVARISTGREKIFTAEDPVEYDFEGICQASVNYRAGLTFPNLLRSLVRQDPDVLLVGEIRDSETADIAVNAALTGHLLLSTLHTTDAISAMPRLLDLGVPDYLIVHTLEAVMAQRLVRTICAECATEHELTDVERDLLGPAAAKLRHYRAGKGCEACRDTGYRGRTGLYEFMEVSDPVREAFLRRDELRKLRNVARDHGLRTLREDGVRKIEMGITTPTEVLRVS